jgi:hypothetical protein
MLKKRFTSLFPKSVRKYGSKLVRQEESTKNNSEEMKSINNIINITELESRKENNKYINIIDLDNIHHINFLNHMYLDYYINEGRGGHIKQVINLFEKLIPIDNVNINNKINNEITNKYKNLKKILDISLHVVDLINDYDYKEFEDEIINILNIEKKILIPSGWIEKINKGHLITIYIEKIDTNKYDFVITNSGSGMDLFSNIKDLNNCPVCNMCKDLNENQIKEILHIIKISMNYKYDINKDEKILKIIKLIDIKENPDYIIDRDDYKKYKSEINENERKQLVDDNDLYQNVYKIIFKIMLKELIEKYPDKDINQLVPISKKDQNKIKKNLHCISQHDNYAYFEELLYKIIFFDKFQE